MTCVSVGCGRSLLYGRTSLSADARAALAAKPGWREASLTIGKLELNGLVRPPEFPEAPWVLYFGGNATTLEGSQWILERIAGAEDMGLAVFAYRGYDGSDGRPTQRALVRDGVAAAAEITALGATPEHLVIVGQSLGAAVAVQVTAELQEAGRAPAGLVLVSPFTSVPAVARDHVGCAPVCLFPDPWRSIRRVHGLRGPALVLHGTKDDVVPIAHGRRIAESLPDARFVELPEKGHNDLWAGGGRGAAAEVVRAFVLEHGR